MSSFKEETMRISAYEQSYVFPHGITALATTSTKFGISAKDLIGERPQSFNPPSVLLIHHLTVSVATQNHKIQSFPRRALNPRRPNRKVTTEEQEEGLIQYDPVIPDDSKRVLSHNYQVPSPPIPHLNPQTHSSLTLLPF